MRVLLLHPPTAGKIGNYRTESLGIGYIAAVLRADGHDVEVLDAHMQCLKTRAVISELLSREYDCLGITAMHQHKDSVMETVRAVRKARPNLPIVLGGYLPTLATELFLKACPEISLVVRGEGEAVTRDVFGRLDSGQDWHDAPGVAFLDGDRVIINQPPPLIKDLNTLPFPARDALKQKHRSVMTQALIAGSRGCYNNCTFCSINSFYAVSGGHAPRFRSPGNFVDEIESVIEETGHRDFEFIDDDFVGPGDKSQARVVQIAQEIIDRGVKIKFNTQARADEMNEETLKTLKRAGLMCLFLGIESGVQRQLDTYGKHITVEQNRHAIEICHNAGVRVEPGFIMFDPYATIDEVQENMRFVKETGLYHGPVPMSKVRLYHGVPLVDKIREDGLLIEDGLNLDYRFKDPQTKVAWKVASRASAFNRFIHNLWLRLGGKNPRDKV